MWLTVLLGLALIGLTPLRPVRDLPGAYAMFAGALLLSLIGYGLTPPNLPPEPWFPPPLLGRRAALELGLLAQTQLPPPAPDKPAIQWLGRTDGGRIIVARPIVIFRNPAAAAFRRRGANRYFSTRFGWPDALAMPFQPRAVIVHSTEGEVEEHAFAIFDRNTEAQYMGGTWTHFSVGPEGRIVQYGPLDRISKGQAGLDDSSVGIETVGTASLWDGPQGQQTRTGSIITRWREGNRAQLLAVADLIATLRRHYGIPSDRVYSHQELGHIRDLRGYRPDYDWLRTHIRDRVYLGLEPTLDKDLKPEATFDFLEPYDRKDPGTDVMQELTRLMAEG